MKCYEWNSEKQALIEVDDPTYVPEISSYTEGIYSVGYVELMSSCAEDSEGAGITIYVNDREGKPDYYISIFGTSRGIAAFVAKDFPSLVETLRYMQPMITLAGLDQFSTARIRDEVRQKYSR